MADGTARTNAWKYHPMMAILLVAAYSCATPRVIDGDTIRCGSERVRLLGIDAPEMPGHCRRGRVCAEGDPLASKRSLVRAAGRGPLRIEPVATDRYGRTVAVVRAGGLNLSCWQLRRGGAIYKPAWDNGRRVGTECPRLRQ
jgi:micrococcal nuclease